VRVCQSIYYRIRALDCILKQNLQCTTVLCYVLQRHLDNSTPTKTRLDSITHCMCRFLGGMDGIGRLYSCKTSEWLNCWFQHCFFWKCTHSVLTISKTRLFTLNTDITLCVPPFQLSEYFLAVGGRNPSRKREGQRLICERIVHNIFVQ